MKQINVTVEDEVYAAAKVGAAHSGMLLRKFIEKAVAEACGVPPGIFPNPAGGATVIGLNPTAGHTIGGAREGGKTARRKRDQGPAALSNSDRMRQMREKS